MTKKPNPLTASRLRADIYRVLDQVIETGTPVEVERKGSLLRIVPGENCRVSRLARLPHRPGYLRADPDSLVHIDWSSEWRP